MMRNSGSPAADDDRAEPRRAAADDAGDRRLDLGAVDAHHQLLPLGARARRSASATASAWRAESSWACARRAGRRLVEGRPRDDLRPELLRAFEIGVGLGERASNWSIWLLRLLDRGVGALVAASFCGEQRVELAAVERAPAPGPWSRGRRRRRGSR